MKDITAIGEILIDLTQSEFTPQGIPRFDANPGGAPANLAVAAARLGASTAFIGRVGRDSFGDFLRSCLAENGVDTTALSVDPMLPTTLAVVALDSAGERSFSFYRNPSADVALQTEDVPFSMLRETRFLHFGSVSLTAEPSRSTTLAAVRYAREQGALISYDPNYRPSLWPDETTAVAQMRAPLPLVDVLKVSDEELPLLSGNADLDTGSRILASQGIQLVLVTLGADGVFYRRNEQTGRVSGVPCTVADTNGAGDAFFGATLFKLAQVKDLTSLPIAKLENVLAFANQVASITTSRHGAIPAMPSKKELTDMQVAMSSAGQ